MLFFNQYYYDFCDLLIFTSCYVLAIASDMIIAWFKSVKVFKCAKHIYNASLPIPPDTLMPFNHWIKF
jgi:hypothetical protein